MGYFMFAAAVLSTLRLSRLERRVAPTLYHAICLWYVYTRVEPKFKHEYAPLRNQR